MNFNIFRREIIKAFIMYHATPELNTEALICLAVCKWVCWVCPCTGRMGWVGLGL